MPLPTKDQVQAAIARTQQLVPAPRTLGRALQLLRDPDSGLYKIAELIGTDSALAVDVLRCANSAYYSRKIRVGAVEEAVQVIGFHETIRLVSLVAIHQTTHRDLASYGIAAEDFWQETVLNGLFIEALARQTGAFDPGEAYTAGLLRFVGRLAIDQALQELGGGLVWDRTKPLPEWERENVGITQAEAGAQLLQKWQFPSAVVAAVGAQDAAYPTLARSREPLVYGMHCMSEMLPAGKGVAALQAEEEAPLLFPENHPFVTTHRLTPEMISDVCNESRRGFDSIRQTLYS